MVYFCVSLYSTMSRLYFNIDHGESIYTTVIRKCYIYNRLPSFECVFYGLSKVKKVEKMFIKKIKLKSLPLSLAVA